jgi:hypothetical protein
MLMLSEPCVVHGDAEGADVARRSLCDWLSSLELIPAGAEAQLDRYIGYWQVYATSHEALDADTALQDEVRNVARVLLTEATERRVHTHEHPGRKLRRPRDK